MSNEMRSIAPNEWGLGIDEAGRGAVLGPMVVAAVALAPQAVNELRNYGLRESKKMKPARRARLARRIRHLKNQGLACVQLEVVSAGKINSGQKSGRNLDCLERSAAVKILRKTNWKGRVVADGRVFEPLKDRYSHGCLKAEPRADSRYWEVAAASVIAKEHRDELFKGIMRRYWPDCREVKGGGYGNQYTECFLRKYHERKGELPLETRRWTWDVIRKLSAPPTQY